MRQTNLYQTQYYINNNNLTIPTFYYTQHCLMNNGNIIKLHNTQNAVKKSWDPSKNCPKKSS